MGIMQLLNIIVIWIFLGLCASHLAKKRGRHPLLWFLLCPFLGIFSFALLFLLPKVVKTTPQGQKPLCSVLPARSESWLKVWYYLDPAHVQQGPIEFPDMIKKWKEKDIALGSYIWGEGMPEWKRLADMPELIKEIEMSR